ncbi:MAG: YicC family protein [Bacteroidales bacterium]|nr:YicC family protein [Bacteroidales bacterium]
MIKSMTGFGKAECSYDNRKHIVEIKTLNSKFLDINARLPNGYKEKELELRSMISNRLLRGKVDFTITLEGGESANYSINKSLVKKYFNDLKEVSGEIGHGNMDELLPTIIRLPDVMIPAREDLSEEEWELLREAVETALLKVDEFRLQEGASLKKELIYRSEKILTLLDEVVPFEKERIETLKNKIKKDLHELVDQEDVDKNRFEQELIFYMERLDITEEKVRLKKHCKYFEETLNEEGAQGKKLGFITQEMGREINTLGSKASEANIQKIVVQMKDELEKIKEQLFNIL